MVYVIILEFPFFFTRHRYSHDVQRNQHPRVSFGLHHIRQLCQAATTLSSTHLKGTWPSLTAAPQGSVWSVNNLSSTYPSKIMFFLCISTLSTAGSCGTAELRVPQLLLYRSSRCTNIVVLQTPALLQGFAVLQSSLHCGTARLYTSKSQIMQGPAAQSSPVLLRSSCYGLEKYCRALLCGGSRVRLGPI